jgi:hypothetical protein
MQIFSGHVQQMPVNNVIWHPKEVEDLLLYYKEKIQELGKALVLREAHHEECAQRFTQKCQRRVVRYLE